MISSALTVIGLFLLYLWPRYFFVSVAGKGVSGFTFFAVLLLFVALARLVLRSDLRRIVAAGVAQSPVVLSLFVAYWLWRLVASFLGVTPAQSVGLTVLGFLYQGSWFIVGAVLLTERSVRRALPAIVLLCGILATAMGVIEFHSGQPISRVLGFYEFQAGDEYTLQTISSSLERGAVMRVRSLFSHPLVYGQVLAAMTPVALHFLLRGRIGGKIAGVALGAAIVASIVLCNARSPYLVAAASGLVYFLLYFFDLRRKLKLFVLMWVAIGALFVLPVASGVFLELTQGRTSEEAISNGARVQQMTAGKAALVSRPINGYGDGNAPDYAGILTRNNSVKVVDNFYLTTAVEQGYVGLALWIALLLAFVLKGIRLGFAEFDEERRSHICIATGTIDCIALVMSILSIVDTQSIIFLFGGFLIALAGLQRVAPLRLRGRSRTSEAGRPFAPDEDQVAFLQPDRRNG